VQVSKIEGDTKSVSKKDESKPKQPATAYLLYCNAHREQARAANPDVSFGDLTKVLSEMVSPPLDPHAIILPVWMYSGLALL
jgi:hypothetical protein